MTLIKRFWNFIFKKLDAFITPLVLITINLVIFDNPDDRIFGRIRGLILRPFVDYLSIPIVGKNVYFLELLTRQYSFGRDVVISYGCKFHGPVSIGSGVYLNYNVEVRQNTVIGNNVNIGPNTLIISDAHDMKDKSRRAGKSTQEKIVIQDGCWIGAGVIILGGVTIGSGSVVAAGAVVNKDVSPNTMVAGVPAKFVKELEV